MYEPFLPRNSSSAYEEMSAMAHAQVNTTISVIHNKDPPYAWHGLQHRRLKWGAPDESRINWGPPLYQQDGGWRLANTGRQLHNSRGTEGSQANAAILDEEMADATPEQPHQTTSTSGWGESPDPLSMQA